MDFVYVGLSFAVVVAIALFLGRLDHHKHPVWYNLGWIGGIVALFVVGDWDGHPILYALLVLAIVLRWIEHHIPAWLFFVVLIGAAAYYILTLIATSLAELGQELERTNARLQLFEESTVDKLHKINRRFPEE